LANKKTTQLPENTSPNDNDKFYHVTAAGVSKFIRASVLKAFFIEGVNGGSGAKFRGYKTNEASILALPDPKDGEGAIDRSTNNLWVYVENDEEGIPVNEWVNTGEYGPVFEIDLDPVIGNTDHVPSSDGVARGLGSKAGVSHTHNLAEAWLTEILANYLLSSSFDSTFWVALKAAMVQGAGVTLVKDEGTKKITVNAIGADGEPITISPTVVDGDGNAVSGEAVFEYTKDYLKKYLWKESTLVGTDREFDFDNVQNPAFEISPTADETWDFINVIASTSEVLNVWTTINYDGITEFTAALPALSGGAVHRESGTGAIITEIVFPSGKADGYITEAFGYRKSDGGWNWSFGEAEGGSGSGSTNLSATPSPTNIVIASDTGTDATIPAADGTNAGLLLPAEKTKITAIDQSVSTTEKATWNAKADTSYVDNAVEGLKWKEAVRAASTGNLTLSGAQTVDGVALVAGERILVKDQSTGSQNGIYVVASGSWSRSNDANASSEILGATVNVREGDVNADKDFLLTNDSIALGSTSLVFVEKGGNVPNGSETAAGKFEEGTDAEVQANTSVGGTGARLVLVVAKLWTWWTYVKTQTNTWSGQQIFSVAPRHSHATASKILKLDSNKDLTSGDLALTEMADQAALTVLANATNATGKPTAVAASVAERVFVRTASNALAFIQLTANYIAALSIGTAHIINNAITLAKMAQLANNKVIGNLSGGMSDPRAEDVVDIFDSVDNATIRTSSYTTISTDRNIQSNHSAPVTYTLDGTGCNAGKPLVVYDVSSAGAGTNNITIAAQTSQSIVGNTLINSNGGTRTYIWDGTSKWTLIAST
jgi:hypothetical protein